MSNKDLNEGFSDIKDAVKDFLDDEEKMKYIEKTGKVAGTIASIGGATTALYKGYKFIKKKKNERDEKKKLEKKKSEEAKKSEDIEIFNLVNEELDLVVFLDENGDIFFMEEEIEDLLECYNIEEEDLYDIIFTEDSNFEIVDLSEGKVKDFFGGIKDRVTSSDRKVKPEHDTKLKGMIADLQKDVKVVNDNMEKNNNNVYNMSAKINEMERKCNRTMKLAIGLGIAVPAALLAIKAVIDNLKKKKRAKEDAAYEKKAKKLKESTINTLLTMDLDLVMESTGLDSLIEELEESFEPFMELVQLDENTVIDVYFTESGMFIDENEMDIILECYDDLDKNDLYDIIGDIINDNH